VIARLPAARGHAGVREPLLRGEVAELTCTTTNGEHVNLSFMSGYQERGPVNGVVARWSDEEGWGAIASPEVEGEIFAFFSEIEGDGYKSLRVGQPVTLTYETPGFLQDGYPHRAVSVQPR
jgi:CspA family cold shock protein